jgi:hypothetical protein
MRKLLVFLVIGAAIAVGAVGSAASASSNANVCGNPGALIGKSHFGGVIAALPVDAQCAKADSAARGNPPLTWHGGPVMGTTSTGPVVVTPIFWQPTGHPMDAAYESLITQYLHDVAAASGSHTNVFSTLTEYFGTNGPINYQIQEGTPINDTNPLPADGCNLAMKDTTGIYPDGSGYNACIDDAQVQAETANVVKANKLPVNFAHIYVLFVPKHVESCFNPGSTATLQKGNQACTINHQKTAAYCAYHFITPSHMIYANMPYPTYHSPLQTAGFTCGSDASIAFGNGHIQSPNGNVDADVEISPTSHELSEAITDPDAATGWYDQIGFENGDECAYVYGTPLGGSLGTAGTPGTFYNQAINGHHYLTQTEFSNQDWLNTQLGCLQSAS